jgi:cytidylate kinase/peroxiredoxin
MARLIDLNAQIVGIDINTPSGNKLLAEKNRLPFPVLGDCNRDVFKSYGLEVPEYVGPDGGSVACFWGTSCYPIAKRSIFVLDEEGSIRYTWVAQQPGSEPDIEKIKTALQQAPSEAQATKTYSVITISRQLGSGGDEIAIKVSETLGYAYFDKNLMVDIAKSIGVSEEEILDFSEDTYKTRSFVDKVFLRKKPLNMPRSLDGTTAIGKSLDEEECLSVIQTVVNGLASRGKTVIVGRGGQAILKNKAGVLHVRVVAPIAVRVERVMESSGLSREDAQRAIEDHDKASAEYLHRFYSVDWDDPLNYDVVVNTGRMSLEAAERLIASVALRTPL